MDQTNNRSTDLSIRLVAALHLSSNFDVYQPYLSCKVVIPLHKFNQLTNDVGSSHLSDAYTLMPR